MKKTDYIFEHFKEMFNEIRTKRQNYTPSQYAERYRTLSSDVSSIQGKFKYNITPYLREIVDTLSPYHPAKIVAVMKSAQIGFTEGVIVNGILWIIANNPGNIMALAANDQLSKEMIESRLDSGIQSCGIQHLIRPNTIRKRNQRTGDTSNYKEYAGGRLFAGGLQSIDKLGKQRSIKYGFFDDWDAAPMSDKKQGNVFDLLQQRFSTNANSMKQYFISTPETRPSNIENIYLKGDQRKWHVPCPKCGTYIELLWHDKDKQGKAVGVVFKKDDTGKLIESSVRYRCQECGKTFKESQKYDINLLGKWIPTAEPEKPGIYSYHISALSSAPQMYDWTHYAYQYLATHKGGRTIQSKLKVFTNLVLGQPWQEKQKAIKSNKLINNTREYEIGIVPNKQSNEDGNGNIILLTCACDLNGTLDDARLDWEVVAHAASGSIYSINHGSIGTYQPKSKDVKRDKWSYRFGEENNVWDVFYNEVINEGYRTDDGFEMEIFLTAVDTGYFTHHTYTFIDMYPSQLIGVKGSVVAKIKTGIDKKKIKQSSERNNLYIIETDLVKDDLAEMIELKWNRETTQPDGFMNFPMPNHKFKKYTLKYFKEYEGEEKKIETDDDGQPIGFKWVRKHTSTPNHFFDCAVYNLATRNIVKDMIMKELKIRNATWSEFAEVMNKN